MANDVYSYVNFHKISDEGIAVFNKLCERFEGWEDERTFEFNFSDVFGLPEELDEEGYNKGPGSYGWNIDNVGAKWCYLGDPSDWGFNTHSAWSVPFDGIEYIFNEIFKVDPDFVGTVTYEDEMPNFVGWATWHHGSYDEGREWEWDGILEWMLENSEVLNECWDAEAEDWKEEKEDERWDEQYEMQQQFMEEVRDTSLMEEMQWYDEHEDEIRQDYIEMLEEEAKENV